MKKSFLAVLVGMAAVMGMVGCGGTVSSGSGGEGGGGSGGNGGSGGTGTTTGTTGTTSTTGTVTNSSTLCQNLCNAGLQAGCFSGSPATCIQGCTGSYTQSPDCTAQLDAAYTCALNAVPVSGCDIETACPDEIAALQMCQGGGCGEGTCSGDGDTMCSCDATCNGVTRQVDCESSASGISCSCYENSTLLGACTGSDLSCDLSGGCCDQYWAMP